MNVARKCVMSIIEEWVVYEYLVEKFGTIRLNFGKIDLIWGVLRNSIDECYLMRLVGVYMRGKFEQV
jgi:hypothetical protein